MKSITILGSSMSGLMGRSCELWHISSHQTHTHTQIMHTPQAWTHEPTCGKYRPKISAKIYFSKMLIPTWEHPLKFLWKVSPNSFLFLTFHWWWPCVSVDYGTGQVQKGGFYSIPQNLRSCGLGEKRLWSLSRSSVTVEEWTLKHLLKKTISLAQLRFKLLSTCRI